MAIMYPSGVFSGTKSPGEHEVFAKLRDDPRARDWIVLHSLDVSDHVSQLQGEVDFAIVVPHKGVLCLEVKAVSSMRLIHGAWYLGIDRSPDYRGPIKQANEGMHSLRRYVTKSAADLSRIPFFSAVIFPYVNFSLESSEWHQWQIIDRPIYTTHSIGEIIENVLDQARAWLSNCGSAGWFRPKARHPTYAETERLAALLRPCFESYESPVARSERRANELLRYTEEQYAALDAMSLNPRVIFEGPAGTGKTLLAVETARRIQADGSRVLLVCYNRLLGQWLSRQVESLSKNVRATTLHSQMLSIANIAIPSCTSEAFWQEVLPQAAVEALLAMSSTEHVYDALIVDEAQDILREPYIDFLDLSLKGGLHRGIWRVFGDFRNQAIYQGGTSPVKTQIDDRFPPAPYYSLRINCRNPMRIAEYVRLLGDLHPSYSAIRRPDNGHKPVIRFYKNEEYERRILSDELDQLHRDGVPDTEIVILSLRAGQKSVAAQLGGKWQSRLEPLDLSLPRTGVGYTTVHAFKGLEASVVIVTDVDSVSNDRTSALFYVALSRAVERLHILVHESVRGELINILLKDSEVDVQ